MEFNIGDVTKQKDISGFYRHLYKTTVDVVPKGEQKDNVNNDQKEKDEMTVQSLTNNSSNSMVISGKNKKQKRQYRKRRQSGSSKEEGEKTSSSSSTSLSSSSSSENESEGETKLKLKKEDKSQLKGNTPENDNAVTLLCKESGSLSKLKDDESRPKKLIIDSTEKAVAKIILNESKNVAELENIWLKRTIGLTFDEAQKRYFERKANRQGSY